MSKIGQFLTDILNFGGHLDFISTQNSYFEFSVLIAYILI